ncbi:SH2 domain-containing protein 4B-like isoform X4 [Littorina saxatilis]|uniref:SH2 domain-containing protein 4B-like isoform X4 n=1 Tax=Littorina saxatilis TaxID=31220 RepID=UPI0038B534E3
MLQQILKDMYIDPEILKELDEEQKQILFVKMREEQVRRWKEKEEDFEEEIRLRPRQPKPGAKKVNFRTGQDGCEWVWVMGEHNSDLTIEEILEQEAQRKAQAQAETEALELRQKEAITRTSQKAREEVAKIEQLRQQYEEAEKKRLQELSEEQTRLRRKSLENMETVKKRRSTEIYDRWREQRQQIDKQAEEASKVVEASFKEQEKKSKEADKEMRTMAQRARIEYKESLRRTNNMIQTTKAFEGSATPPENKPPIPPKKHLMSRQSTLSAPNNKSKPRPLRPRNHNMVIDWFFSEEKDKGSGLNPETGKIATWFHGIISRLEAEKLLADKGTGAFLVRVSERVWGYTISYQEKNRCKHFLVDTTDLGYQFFGANQVIHKSLAELVNFHKDTPITISGQERLVEAVGQISDPPDYCELFQERRSVSTAL